MGDGMSDSDARRWENQERRKEQLQALQTTRNGPPKGAPSLCSPSKEMSLAPPPAPSETVLVECLHLLEGLTPKQRTRILRVAKAFYEEGPGSKSPSTI